MTVWSRPTKSCMPLQANWGLLDPKVPRQQPRRKFNPLNAQGLSATPYRSCMANPPPPRGRSPNRAQPASQQSEKKRSPKRAVRRKGQPNPPAESPPRKGQLRSPNLVQKHSDPNWDGAGPAQQNRNSNSGSATKRAVASRPHTFTIGNGRATRRPLPHHPATAHQKS